MRRLRPPNPQLQSARLRAGRSLLTFDALILPMLQAAAAESGASPELVNKSINLTLADWACSEDPGGPECHCTFFSDVGAVCHHVCREMLLQSTEGHRLTANQHLPRPPPLCLLGCPQSGGCSPGTFLNDTTAADCPPGYFCPPASNCLIRCTAGTRRDHQLAVCSLQGLLSVALV